MAEGQDWLWARAGWTDVRHRQWGNKAQTPRLEGGWEEWAGTWDASERMREGWEKVFTNLAHVQGLVGPAAHGVQSHVHSPQGHQGRRVRVQLELQHLPRVIVLVTVHTQLQLHGRRAGVGVQMGELLLVLSCPSPTLHALPCPHKPQPGRPPAGSWPLGGPRDSRRPQSRRRVPGGGPQTRRPRSGLLWALGPQTRSVPGTEPGARVVLSSLHVPSLKPLPPRAPSRQVLPAPALLHTM